MDNVTLLMFDLDNTLINYGGVTKEAWNLTCMALVRTYHIPIDAQIIANEIIRINDELWNDENKRPHGNFSFSQLRTSIVKEALQNVHMYTDEYCEFLVLNYANYKHEAVYVFEDVVSTLLELKKRGYIITLLTNGDALTQREKLQRFQLTPYFDGIFIDGEQGIGKPEKEAYENVCHHFHVTLEQACMIGDHYLWEVVAPKQYGMHAIWVNRGELGKTGNEQIKPDVEIKEIKEVLNYFL